MFSTATRAALSENGQSYAADDFNERRGQYLAALFAQVPGLSSGDKTKILQMAVAMTQLMVRGRSGDAQSYIWRITLGNVAAITRGYRK